MSRSSQGHKTLREKIFPEVCCSNRQKNKERVLELIENHPCFLEITLWKNIKVESLHIEDLPKKEMTKEYLRIVCSTCEENINKFKEMSIEEMCRVMTSKSVSAVISSVLKDINREAAIAGIPYIFLEKIDTILSRHIEVMADSMNNLQLYREWDKPEDKILATLDVLYTAVRIIGDDVPNIVNSMNGTLRMVLKGSKFDKQ